MANTDTTVYGPAPSQLGARIGSCLLKCCCGVLIIRVSKVLSLHHAHCNHGLLKKTNTPSLLSRVTNRFPVWGEFLRFQNNFPSQIRTKLQSRKIPHTENLNQLLDWASRKVSLSRGLQPCSTDKATTLLRLVSDIRPARWAR